MRSLLSKFLISLALLGSSLVFAQGGGQFGNGGGTSSSGTITGNNICINSDTGITRSAALTLNMGTCTNGNSTGTLNVTNLSVTNAITAAGAGAGRFFFGQAATPIPLTNGEEIIANAQTVANGSQLILQAGWGSGGATVVPSTAATAGAVTLGTGAITAIAVNTAGLYPYGMFAAGGSGPSVSIDNGCSGSGATASTTMDVTNGTTVASINIGNGGSGYVGCTGSNVHIGNPFLLQQNLAASAILFGTTGGTSIAVTTGQEDLYTFSLNEAVSFTKIAYVVGTSDASANLYDFGLYCNQAPGCGQYKQNALICHTGAIAGTSSMTAGAHDVSCGGTFVLPPGKYTFAWTANAGAGALSMSNNTMLSLLAHNTSIANAGGGVLAATIAIPADSVSSTSQPMVMLH